MTVRTNLMLPPELVAEVDRSPDPATEAAMSPKPSGPVSAATI
jgi:hypothetical protein